MAKHFVANALNRILDRAIQVLGAAAAASSFVACAGSWDVRALEARTPGLAPSHRLGDATPYLLPVRDELLLFLCRWETPVTLGVALPAEATPRERELIERALAAFEGAGLGIDFDTGAAPGDAAIEIRFGGTGGDRVATTGAECAVDLGAEQPGTALSARLVFASVALGREQSDAIGRLVPLSDEELVGSALHELGHALGYQGHARRGATVMVRSVDHVRWAGRRLLAGEPFRDETLRALYRVPSGALVGRPGLPPGRSAPVDGLHTLAARRALRGPFVRVGDRAAWIAWAAEGGEAFGVLVGPLPDGLRRPSTLAFAPGPAAAAALRAAGVSHPGT